MIDHVCSSHPDRCATYYNPHTSSDEDVSTGESYCSICLLQADYAAGLISKEYYDKWMKHLEDRYT